MGSTGHWSSESNFLKALNSLRAEGEFLDITLIVENVHFKAHKVILSSCSDYFRAMLTNKMLESRQDEIILNEITAAGFSQILEYFYTSKIILDLSNAQDVLEAAVFLQVPEAIHICLEHLSACINIDSCFDIATLTEMYSLGELKMKVYKFMSEHLLELSKSEEFYRLTSRQVQNLLSPDFCVDCSEDDVLRIVLAWFFHVDHSKEDFKHIIHLIHFNQISRRRFDNILEECFEDISRPELEWYREMLLKYYFQRSNNSESINSNLPRGMEMVIIQCGGAEPDNALRQQINFRSLKEKKWRHLTTTSHPCFGNTISVLNNELYVTGSEEEDYAIKFSPRSNEWKITGPMKIKGRHLHSLNTLDNKLYAVCGCTFIENVQKPTNTCECYNPELDAWEIIEPFPIKIADHAGASYECSKSPKLFISGGWDEDTQCLSSMYCYTVREDKWSNCAPMLTSRLGHEMFSIGNYIYVCGGEMTVDYTSPVDTIDVYDIKNNRWGTVTNVPTPRSWGGIVCVEHKIYFIGGLDANDQPTATIECYDIDANSWTSTIDKHPDNLRYTKCASLLIPKWRDY